MDYIALRRIEIGGVVYNLGDTITADAFADAGADAYKLLCRKWIQYAGEVGGGIPDAPVDGKLYGRQDAAWEEVISAGGGIPEAPNDGKIYGRQSAAWEEVPAPAPAPDLTPYVKKHSPTTQILDSNIALDRGNILLGTKASGAEAVLAEYAIYVEGAEFTGSKTVFGVPYTAAEIAGDASLIGYVTTSKAVLSTDGTYYYNNAGVWTIFTPTSTVEQAEIGSETEHLNLNSTDRPTVDLPGGKEGFAFLSDIPFPITPELLGIDASGLDPAKEYLPKLAYDAAHWIFTAEEIVRS
ncbi:hypothetical protein FACS1894216_01380 [Synergistales bacterium]|nr:hypothetical protein FACS1894216_01380 [Synergistales bacterium]